MFLTDNSGFSDQTISGTEGQGQPTVQINLKKLQLFPILSLHTQ